MSRVAVVIIVADVASTLTSGLVLLRKMCRLSMVCLCFSDKTFLKERTQKEVVCDDVSW